MEEKLSKKQKELDWVIANNKRNNEALEFNLTKEINVNKVIVDRQNNYIDVLKKELVLAKNVMKRPRMFQ